MIPVSLMRQLRPMVRECLAFASGLILLGLAVTLLVRNVRVPDSVGISVAALMVVVGYIVVWRAAKGLSRLLGRSPARHRW